MDALRKIFSWWTISIPVLAVVALVLSWGHHVATLWLLILAVLLIGAVLAAVQHAEAIAHHVGEPFGSLVLAVAVTVIEVSLILMLTLGGKGGTQTLARDSIFAVVMMTMNGVVGLCLFVAAHKHHLAVFNAEGAGSALGSVLLLTGLTLILPRFTTSATGSAFSLSQLLFAGAAALVVYALFVFTQTVRHRDAFLVPDSAEDAAADDDFSEGPEQPEEQPGDLSGPRSLPASVALLLVALIAVVGLAKVESPGIEAMVEHFGLPQAIVGVIIALIILLPETIAAIKSAAQGQTQTSLNLAYGSAMASIGLTIPVLAFASFWLPGRLMLGLDSVHIILFAISAIVSILTVVPGRAKTLNGGLHLALFAAFLFLTIVP